VIREKRDYKNSYEAADLPEQEELEKSFEIYHCVDTQKRTKLDNLCANSLINRPNRGMKNGTEPPTNAIHTYYVVYLECNCTMSIGHYAV